MEIKIHKKTLFDHMSVLFGSGIARGIALLNNIIIARVLDVSDYGRFSLFYITMLSIWMIPQAFDTTFIRYTKSNNAQYNRDDIFRAILQFKLGFMLVIILTVYPVTRFISEYTLLGNNISVLIFLGAICGACMCFVSTISTVFQEREKFGLYALTQGSYTVLVLLALAVGLSFFNDLSLHFVLVVYLMITFSVGLVCLIISIRMISFPFKFNHVLIVNIFSFSKWVFGTSVIFYLFPRIDTYILVNYVEFTQIGIYSVATQLTMIVTLLTGSMSIVYMPKCIAAARNRETFLDYLRECVIPVMFMVAMILCLSVLASPLIRFLFGVSYGLAVTPLRILLLGYLLSSIYLPISYLFFAFDKPQIRFYLEVMKLFIAFIAMIYFAPRYGINGAALGVSLALGITSAVSTLVVFRMIRSRKFLT